MTAQNYSMLDPTAESSPVMRARRAPPESPRGNAEPTTEIDRATSRVTRARAKALRGWLLALPLPRVGRCARPSPPTRHGQPPPPSG